MYTELVELDQPSHQPPALLPRLASTSPPQPSSHAPLRPTTPGEPTVFATIGGSITAGQVRMETWRSYNVFHFFPTNLQSNFQGCIDAPPWPGYLKDW